jgi:hypothetical protein
MNGPGTNLLAAVAQDSANICLKDTSGGPAFCASDMAADEWNLLCFLQILRSSLRETMEQKAEERLAKSLGREAG